MNSVRVPILVLASAWLAMLALLGFLWYSVSLPGSQLSSQLVLLLLACLTVTFGVLFAWQWRQNTNTQATTQTKADLVSIVAHDLRTPLTAIIGYVSVLLHDDAGNLTTDQIRFINRINISAQHVKALTENILSAAKLERNSLTIAKEPTNWGEFIQQAMEELQTQADDKGIDLKLTPVSTLPKIMVDPLRMGEVVNNIISNAITYTPPGGSVTIAIEVRDNTLVTHVTDTGPGIPQNALPHLFEKFFRVYGNGEAGSKGNGLGLYITKAIVTLHQGTIWVESTINQGSTFSFALPLES